MIINRKKIFLILLVILIESIFLSTSVFAYLNPGTGAAIIGSLWPLILIFFSAMLAFAIKWFWRPIKKAFSKMLLALKKAKD